MNRIKRTMVISTLAEELRKNGSWCGETHLQKAVYFLQEMLRVPLGFQFVLYKHGPFSFDLRDELTAMRADGLLVLVPRRYPFGPSLAPTKRSEELQRQFPVTLSRYQRLVSFVATELGNKGVSELERLATALYVTLDDPCTHDREVRGNMISTLKPHISVDDGVIAVDAVDEIIRRSDELRVEQHR